MWGNIIKCQEMKFSVGLNLLSYISLTSLCSAEMTPAQCLNYIVCTDKPGRRIETLSLQGSRPSTAGCRQNWFQALGR